MRKHSGAASSQRLNLHLRHHLRQLRREGSSHVLRHRLRELRRLSQRWENRVPISEAVLVQCSLERAHALAHRQDATM